MQEWDIGKRGASRTSRWADELNLLMRESIAWASFRRGDHDLHEKAGIE
jgi:hypothetical protein